MTANIRDVNLSCWKARKLAKKLTKAFWGLRKDSDYETCDRILSKMHVDRMSDAALLSVLTVTAPMKPYLRARDGFVSRVKDLLLIEHDQETVEKMLSGLV